MNCLVIWNFWTAPVKITKKPSAVPYSATVARRVPIPSVPDVQAELRRMEAHGIIKRINDEKWLMRTHGTHSEEVWQDLHICGLKRLNESGGG